MYPKMHAQMANTANFTINGKDKMVNLCLKLRLGRESHTLQTTGPYKNFKICCIFPHETMSSYS